MKEVVLHPNCGMPLKGFEGGSEHDPFLFYLLTILAAVRGMGGKEMRLEAGRRASEDVLMAFQARKQGDFLGQGQPGRETSR